MKKILDLILKYWVIIIFLLGLIGSIFSFILQVYKKLNTIQNITTTNQKVSLKNTIWNNNIPLEDRITSCDAYLSLGYNSYTKKYCQRLLESEDIIYD